MTSEPEPVTKNEVIIHVLVVGFHHKKGCVVEYSYPALSEGDDVTCTDLPEPWKHLPTLALPDGAHNFEEDTIYFHLPSIENPQKTVYGISCYRQMNAQQLLRRSSDITRETVQKSVCVLSRLPLYGLIQAKLELITHAYFDERDFSKVSLLEETYRNLNSSLPKDLLDGQQAFLGLSVRDFVLRFKHKTLLLFKLLLLERRVLFYKAPVKSLCSTILTLCSLVPGLIESGLGESAQEVIPHLFSNDTEEFLQGNNNKICNNSFELNNTSESIWYEKTDEEIEAEENAKMSEPQWNVNNNIVLTSEGNLVYPDVNFRITDHSDSPEVVKTTARKNSKDTDIHENRLSQSSTDTEGESWIKVNQLTPDLGSSATSITSSDTEMKADRSAHNNEEKLLSEVEEMLNIGDDTNPSGRKPSLEFQSVSASTPDFSEKGSLFIKGNSLNSLKSTGIDSSSSPNSKKRDASENRRKSESQMEGEQAFDNSNSFGPNVLDLDSKDCGLPLSIFTKGMLCHPYLSLPFLDILSDVSVRGFFVGATNILFKQKKHLFDVIIEVDDGKIEILDPELRKNISLTTEDLRFADHLVRHVMDDKKDVFLDGTGWEGGDEWLRSQFKLYLISIMRTSFIESPSSKEIDAFNAGFMTSWKSTHNYKIWYSGHHSKILKLNPGHPFHGQLSMADMKLRFSHSMQNTEKGRRINNAVTSTGKAVLQTGKVVGGALSSAKSVVSSWWSTFNVPQQPEKREEEKDFEPKKDDFQEKQLTNDLNAEKLLYSLDIEP